MAEYDRPMSETEQEKQDTPSSPYRPATSCKASISKRLVLFVQVSVSFLLVTPVPCLPALESDRPTFPRPGRSL